MFIISFQIHSQVFLLGVYKYVYSSFKIMIALQDLLD